MLRHMELLKKIERAQRSMIVAKTTIETAEKQLSAAENIQEENWDKLEEFVRWNISMNDEMNQHVITDLFTEIRNRNATVENDRITFKNDNDIKIEVDVIQQSTGKILVIVDLDRSGGLIIIGKDSNPLERLRSILKRRDFFPHLEKGEAQRLINAMNPMSDYTDTWGTLGDAPSLRPKTHKGQQPLCTEYVQAGIPCSDCIHYDGCRCTLTMLERGELQ